MKRPADATPTPSCEDVRRRSRETNSAAAPASSVSAQHPREDLQPLAGAHHVASEAADVALEQHDARAGVEVFGELRVELLQRRRHDRPHVGQRQRQRVAVAGEDRAVRVEHRAAEEAAERAPAHDAGHRGGDQRPRRDQVGVVAQHDLVGHALADRGADRRLRERRRRAVRELAGVEEGEPRVARDRRTDEQHRREHHQRGRPATAHAPEPYPRDAASVRFST
jgi:hypothetical protein